MEKITVKIIDWDELNGFLIVKFLEDGVELSNSEPLNFQPYSLDSLDFNNQEETIKIIAKAGMEMIEYENKKKSFNENEDIVKKYRELKGKEIEFDVTDLL